MHLIRWVTDLLFAVNVNILFTLFSNYLRTSLLVKSGLMSVIQTVIGEQFREYLLCMRVLLECLNLVLFALSGSELSICLAVSIHTVFCTCQSICLSLSLCRSVGHFSLYCRLSVYLSIFQSWSICWPVLFILSSVSPSVYL